MPTLQEPTDVLIKVAACGICGSDIKILEGKHAYKENTVLGHEFCGKVAEIGAAVHSLKVGDRIAIDNNPRCGVCDYCRMGFSSQCEWIKERTIGIFKNGGYAEYAVAPESVCYKLPDSMDDITATQVETLGTVMNGMNTVQMQPWDSVLVLGCGPIGYLFTSLAKNIAAEVMVTEIDPFRLNIAKQLNVPALNPNETDLAKEIKERTNGKGVDVVIDAVGTQLGEALKYVTAGGKILAFGMDDSAQITVTPYQITAVRSRFWAPYRTEHHAAVHQDPPVRQAQLAVFHRNHQTATGRRRLQIGSGSEDHAACAEKALKIVLKPLPGTFSDLTSPKT